MNRRKFIQNTALASSAFLVPNFLKSTDFRKTYGSRSGKTLVVIQLSGGNDGLNTIVPFNNDIYYKLRPRLAVSAADAIRLNDHQALNPALQALQNIYDNGEMTILNNVGYPNPNRSHFRSMDIWQTGSGSHQYIQTGWLGRYLDSECQNCQPHYALDVDDKLNLALKGSEISGFATDSFAQLNRKTKNRYLQLITKHHQEQDHENVEYLYKTLIDTQSSAEYLFEKSKIHRSTIKYPNHKFANDLKTIAELMTADADIKIYYATLDGFDTHAGQKMKQDKLLKTYADSISTFIKDLKSNDLFNDTLIMTFSEFGRRVKQNASGGTDHGTANNLFLMGGKLKKAGIYNEAPNLSNLDNGDLIYNIDFRQIYAEVLNRWLDTDATKVLNQKFNSLGVI